MPKITARNLLTADDGRYSIEPNLYFLVRGGGKYRTFFFRYQTKGRRRDMSLGSPPDVTISAAKEQAATFRAILARGIDPINAREARRLEDSARIPTLREFLPRAEESLLTLKRPKSEFNVRRAFRAIERHLLPALGRKYLNDITPKDVAEAIEPFWSRVMGNQMRFQLEGVFMIAIREGYCTSNPATWKGVLSAWLPPVSKAVETQHFKAPTIDELRTFVLRCIEARDRFKCALGLALCALTATRKQEATYATAEEFDLSERVWSIPPIRRKDLVPEPFRIPLSNQVSVIVEHLTKTRTGQFFTSGVYKPTMSCAGTGEVHRILRGEGTYSMHGIRSTFSSWAAESGIDFELRERCLMHKTENRVAQVYQRSDLLEQRREVMQRWADVILPMDVLEAALKK